MTSSPLRPVTVLELPLVAGWISSVAASEFELSGWLNAIQNATARPQLLAGLWGLWENGTLSALCWAENLPGQICQLRPPLADPNLSLKKIRDLLAQALAGAAAAGATWCQCLTGPAQRGTYQAIFANRLSHFTALSYQIRELSGEDVLPEIDPTEFTPYAPAGDREALELLLLRTYEQSQDCPRLDQWRNPGQALSGYAAVGHSGTAEWWWARGTSRTMGPAMGPGDQPGQALSLIGCVLLAVHPEGENATHCKDALPAGGLLELLYWGVIPEARGQRYGKKLVAWAIWRGKCLRAKALVATVDVANTPALGVYQELGFVEALRLDLWGCGLPAE
ncbi:MAG: GNAT family N-acetyltransferase [Pirellulales bacterium]|nr:GNAT family N-acetyltransferase [Pirellulales bacterium]